MSKGSKLSVRSTMDFRISRFGVALEQSGTVANTKGLMDSNSPVPSSAHSTNHRRVQSKSTLGHITIPRPK
ncbi:MAG: hypothetical protein AB8B55_21470 [Mariniblastus sp.]